MKRATALLFPALLAAALYWVSDLASTLSGGGADRAQDSAQVELSPPLDARSRIEDYRAHFLAATPLPDALAYAEEIESTRFDEQGRRRYRLTAEAQTRVSDALSVLQRPRVTLFEEGAEEWRISAEFGRVERGAEQAILGPSSPVALLGDALLLATQNNPAAWQLRSATLLLDPDRETVASGDPVELRDTGLLQTSIGFDADLQTDTMHFHSSVKGSYAPPRSQ